MEMQPLENHQISDYIEKLVGRRCLGQKMSGMGIPPKIGLKLDITTHSFLSDVHRR